MAIIPLTLIYIFGCQVAVLVICFIFTKRAYLYQLTKYHCLIYNQAISQMFKLICTNPFFLFAAQASGAGKYIIKNGAYLIEAPPKRPVGSYALFIKDNTSGKKNLNVAESGSNLGKKWNQYEEIRKKYTDLAKENRVSYAELKEEYEKKYVIPFKPINSHNLRLKKLFANKEVAGKGKGIEGIGQQVKKALQQQPRTVEQDEKFKQQAQKIRQERQEQKRKYLIPYLPYPTLKSYKMKQSVPKLQRGADYDKQMEEGYNLEVQKWKENVRQWLADNKYDLTLQEFLTLREKDLKTQKKKKAQKADKANKSESSDDY